MCLQSSSSLKEAHSHGASRLAHRTSRLDQFPVVCSWRMLKCGGPVEEVGRRTFARSVPAFLDFTSSRPLLHLGKISSPFRLRWRMPFLLQQCTVVRFILNRVLVILKSWVTFWETTFPQQLFTLN